MANYSGDGGTDGGTGVFDFFLGRGGTGVAGTTPIPFGGTLDTTHSGFSTVIGAKFPDDAWAPALRAQLVLAEFAQTDWRAKVPPGPDNGKSNLRKRINELLLKRHLRSERAAEIVLQANNTELYWSNLLMLGASRMHTATIVAVGLTVGRLVGMYWKDRFKRPRPSQVFPAIMPIIKTPDHPSYPSGHALQAHIISAALRHVFGNASPMTPHVEALAMRISLNREIAGVHFSDDTMTSINLAPHIVEILMSQGKFIDLVDTARMEWQGLTAGDIPQDIGKIEDPDESAKGVENADDVHSPGPNR